MAYMNGMIQESNTVMNETISSEQKCNRATNSHFTG